MPSSAPSKPPASSSSTAGSSCEDDHVALTERPIGRFRARGDSGKIYIVVERQKFIRVGTDGSPELPGTRRFVLDDGRDVNQVDAETFKIFATDEIIRKIP